MNEVVSYDNGEAHLIPFFVYGTGLALPLVVGVALLVHVLGLARRARAARRVEDEPAATLAAGRAVVVGTARSIDGDVAMVEIKVKQRGTSQAHNDKKGRVKKWTTRWTEVSRACAARSFVVQTPTTDVRVEPGPRARLLDTMVEERRQGPERWMVAKLDEGERVHAYGVLSQEHDPRAAGPGYRGGGTAWVLRPDGGSMLLSVGRMSDRLRAALPLRAAIGCALLAFVLFVHALSAPYHVAVFGGHTEPAEVIRVTTSIRPKKETSYSLVYRRLSTGVELTDQISEPDVGLFTPGRIVPIHVSRFMGDDRVTLGAGASMSAAGAVLPSLLVFPALGLAVWLVRRRRPWYDRPKLVGVTDGKIEG